MPKCQAYIFDVWVDHNQKDDLSFTKSFDCMRYGKKMGKMWGEETKFAIQGRRLSSWCITHDEFHLWHLTPIQLLLHWFFSVVLKVLLIMCVSWVCVCVCVVGEHDI